MTAGVFDYLGKRVKELGIEPVYGSVEEQSVPRCPRAEDPAATCVGSCAGYYDCFYKLGQGT